MRRLNRPGRCEQQKPDVGNFTSAVVGAIVGGILTFSATWWQVRQQNVSERQAAACVLGGELQIVHSVMLSASDVGQKDATHLIGALAALRMARLNPSPNSWALAVKLDPPLARDISRFRASLSGILNMLEYEVILPNPMLPVADDVLASGLLRKITDLAGVSGSFSNQLQVICEHGGTYTPTIEEATFKLDSAK